MSHDIDDNVAHWIDVFSVMPVIQIRAFINAACISHDRRQEFEAATEHSPRVELVKLAAIFMAYRAKESSLPSTPQSQRKPSLPADASYCFVAADNDNSGNN